MEGYFVDASSLGRLAEVFSQVADPRKARGVRHPFPAILSLVFLGLLARITEMAVVTRWAAAHWDELKEPLGFTREKPPCDTTISRALAKLPSRRPNCNPMFAATGKLKTVFTSSKTAGGTRIVTTRNGRAWPRSSPH